MSFKENEINYELTTLKSFLYLLTITLSDSLGAKIYSVSSSLGSEFVMGAVPRSWSFILTINNIWLIEVFFELILSKNNRY